MIPGRPDQEPPIPDLCILIPAAGMGERLGRGPKALLELNGAPAVSWLARKAGRIAAEVLIAVPEGLEQQIRTLCPGSRVIPGGRTRQETIERLVSASSRSWLLVQDVARPFVSGRLLRAVVEAARETGAAGAFLQPEVPVAIIQEGRVSRYFLPVEVGVFQAPQVFERKLLEGVLAEAAAKGWVEQSTLQLVLRAGHPVRSVPGEKTNIKITTEEDIILADSLRGWLA